MKIKIVFFKKGKFASESIYERDESELEKVKNTADLLVKAGFYQRFELYNLETNERLY